jgi:hypothetical protein
MGKEVIYDIYWEGPYSWEEKNNHFKKQHVLYQLYGAHHLYGRDILLYIGSTEKGIQRLKEHEWWVNYEYDSIRVRLGSLGRFTTWDKWNKIENYKKADMKIVHKIESLLIFAHQPAYNQVNKENANKAKGIRIFNSGKFGQLFPEVSYKCFLGV